MQYWLLKSEPDVFSIDDLSHLPNQISCWEGVRNYQARNMLRDQMKKADLAFFYHSSCKVPGIVGIVKIIKEGYPDYTAFDPESRYFDPQSHPNKPRWYRVDVQLVRKLQHTITLAELRTCQLLNGMQLLKKGNRLSVMPITPHQWQVIIGLCR
jgi:predicted RNA-binding protein with PUA-like domain